MKKRHRRRRRGCFRRLALLLLCVGLAWQSNRGLEVEHTDCTLAHLPAAFEGYTLAHLSDLHGTSPEKLLRALQREAPDAIVITGDLIDAHTENPLAYAKQLGSALVAIAPVYYVTGNHEWAGREAEDICEVLSACGVLCLRNEAKAIRQDGETLVIAGVDDPNGYADQKTPAEVADELVEAYGDAVCWILLAHRNDRFPWEYAPLGADVTLSGHGHGGIIRLPFTDGIMGTEGNLFPTYTNGWYQLGESKLFVSRGLGNVAHTLRLFNPPHLPILTLHAERRAL